MPLPPQAVVLESRSFAHLCAAIRGRVEDELHRQAAPPAFLRVYLNADAARQARAGGEGTALIAWARAQGIREVLIRQDPSGRLLAAPRSAFWLHAGE